MKGKVIHLRTIFDDLEMKEKFVAEICFDEIPPLQLGDAEVKQ